LEILKESITLTREQIIRKSQIQKELMKVYENEEEFWH
jgi:hypothetical protein